MRSFCLSTGSSGNCFYVESNNKVKVLIDLGLTYIKTEELLLEKGIEISEITDVFITHEHSDHIVGLKTFIKKNPKCNIHISKGTFEEATNFKVNEKSKQFNIVKNHDSFKIDDLKIFVIGKPHDSKEAISFIFNDDYCKLGVFTDLGHINNEIKHALKTLDVIYFEANYCEEKIEKVKEKFHFTYLNRLMSDVGHLGLQQSIEALVDFTRNEQKIILSHISENTNSYENTYVKIKKALEDVGKLPEILVGFQGESSEWIE